MSVANGEQTAHHNPVPASASAGSDLQHELDSLISKLKLPTFTVYNDANPASNPVDIWRCYLTDELAKVTGVDANIIYPSLAWTNTLDKGDLILAVPKLRIKGAQPAEKAQEWAKAFPENTFVKQPVADGISVRFDYNPSIVPALVIPQVFALGEKYGLTSQIGLKDPENPSKGRKLATIEFSSPNIAKEFHVGHLRSTIIGAFLSNLYEGLGWKVERLNYLGDWGRQFGLLAIGWERYGDEAAFEADPIQHLHYVYVKINADFKPEDDAYKAAKKSGGDTAKLESEGLLGKAKAYFKRMEDGDPEALALWQRFRDLSVQKYEESYKRLNVVFSEYLGESRVKQDTIDEAEKVLKEKGITEENDGATIVDFKKHGAKKLGVAVIRNRAGTSTYLLRDVGSAIQRERAYHMDKSIYVVMSEQDVHCAQFFKLLELMGGDYKVLSEKMQHVTFGKIMGMSTRKGTVKFLGETLDDIRDSMHDVMRQNADKYSQVEEPEQTADTLGISSIMIQDMGGKRINNYKFELDRMLSFEGDTGPYLQYAHARLCSIGRKTGYTHEQLEHADFSLLKEKHAVDLCRLIASWPDVVLHTYKTLEPATILTYLFRLTHQLSSSYSVLQVVGAAEGPETSLARASMYEAARIVLNNGLRLIGLRPVQRM